VWPQKALNDNGDVQAIYLRIDSSGGDIAAAGRIATALIAHRAKKIAIVDRTCWSCAYRIAAAATRIFARKDATFMLHPTSCLSHGNHVDLRNQANVLQDIDYRYLDFIRSMRRKVSRDQLLELQRSERFFSATEALELGLVDRLTESLAPAPAGISTSPVRSTDEQE
jgi:ATP-dependent protease ClpP protease subunit